MDTGYLKTGENVWIAREVGEVADGDMFGAVNNYLTDE